MQPTMTMTTATATDGADALEENAMLQYMSLSEENKKLVNLYVQTLLKEQCIP